MSLGMKWCLYKKSQSSILLCQYDSETKGGLWRYFTFLQIVNWWHSPAAHLQGRVWSVLQLWLAPSLELELASWCGAFYLPLLALHHVPAQSSLQSAATRQTPHTHFVHLTLFMHYRNGLDMLICVTHTQHKHIKHAWIPHPCLFQTAQYASCFPMNPALQLWEPAVIGFCVVSLHVCPHLDPP